MTKYNFLIEVTGVPCSGKSTLLRKLHKANDIMVIPDVSDVDSPIMKFFSNSRKGLQFASSFFCKNITLSDILWLFKVTMSLREPLVFRLNVFRNCMMKFYYHDRFSLDAGNVIKNTIYLDEGISHIPYLLQNQENSEQIISDFFDRFAPILKNINVLVVQTKDCTLQRLLKRGHKRILGLNLEGVKNFDNMNYSTAELVNERRQYFLSYKVVKDD